jgi:predicted restriction endonuclease
MKRYTKTYFDFFGYDTSDTIYCEVCAAVAVDIHHIQAKGMGGNPKGDRDEIENIMALCRPCHESLGDKKQHKDYLRSVHNSHLMKRKGIEKASIADDEQHEVTPDGKIIFKHDGKN